MSNANKRSNEIVDDGCEVASSCFDCSLLACRYDDPGVIARESRRLRDNKIVSHRKQGTGIPEIATQFKLGVRTVNRILKERGLTRVYDYGEKAV